MQTSIKFFSAVILVLVLITQASCDNEGRAQSNSQNIDSAFSGSFVTGSVNSDTNQDGRPSFNRYYEGTSNLGELSIFIADEFAVPTPPDSCPQNTLEFLLVSGSFVIRTPGGDLIMGDLLSAVSCFDPETSTSEINYEGEFTKGTGSFENISGDLAIKINSKFLNLTSVDGFASGGSTGTLDGVIDFSGDI